MTMTMNSGISSSVGLAAGGTGGNYASADEISTVVSVTDGSGLDNDSTSLLLAADIMAIGENTYANISLQGYVDGGNAMLSTELTAIAATSDGSPAYVSYYTLAELGGDFDHMVSVSGSSTSSLMVDGTAVIETTAMTSIQAFDYGAALQQADGPTLPAASVPVPIQSDQQCGCGAGFDGNTAIFDVSAIALGDASFVQLDTFAISVEDMLSEVTINLVMLSA